MTDSPVPLEFNPLDLLKRDDPGGRLESYYDTLRVENRKVNLVSRETIDTGLETLAAESLLPFEKIDRDQFERYLDIGSGGGFPSIPMILLKNIADATLLERISKKSLALERIVRALGVTDRVDVECRDLEQYRPSVKYDLITLRLVKLTAKISRVVAELLSPGGYFVYYAIPPEDFSMPGESTLSYCYRVNKTSPEKYFTIIKKN